MKKLLLIGLIVVLVAACEKTEEAVVEPEATQVEMTQEVEEAAGAVEGAVEEVKEAGEGVVEKLDEMTEETE